MDNNFYKQVMKESSVGYAYHRIICDTNGIPCDYEFIDVNIAFEKLTGLKKKDIIGKKITEVLPDIIKNKFNWISFYGEIALNGGKKEFENYSESLKKTYKVNVFSPEKDYFITQFTDVSEEIDEFIFENALEAIVIVQDGKLQKVNPIAEKITGYSEEELIPMPFLDLIYDKDRNYIIDIHSKRVNEDDYSTKSVFRIIRKDKKIVWVEANGVKIKWNGEKAILYFVVVITERKQVEEELRESEEKYRVMTENSSDVIWHLAIDDCFDYISPADERLRGFKQEEVIGTTIWSHLKPEGVEYVRLIKAKRLEEEKRGIRTKAVRYEVEEKCKDGSWIWVEINTTAHHNQNGEIIGLHGVTRDISERKIMEKALKKSEEEYKFLFENALEIIVIVQDGYIKKCNQMMESLTGFSQKELELIPYIKLIHPDDVQFIINNHKKRLNGETFEKKYSFKILGKNGDFHWVSMIGQVIKWEGREATLGFLMDITDRKIAEEALKKSEEEYRFLFEHALEAIVIIQGNYVKMCNPMIEVLGGYSKQEIMEMPYTQFIHPEDVKRIVSNHKKRLAGKVFESKCKFRIIRKDGSIRWVDMNSSRIAWDEKVATLSFLIDITEQKKIEEALLESEEKYRFMTENASDTIWHTTSDLIFDYVSPTDERLRGYRKEEVLGTSVWSLLKPEGVEHIKQVMAKRLEDEKNGEILGVNRFSVEVKCKNGTWVWVEISVNPHYNQKGEVIGYHGVTRDISHRKEMEVKLREMAIRDPLTNIYNRRYIFERIDSIIAEYIREKNTFSIAIFDLDYFKNVNDSFGHQAGDFILIEFTKIIAKNLRPYDLLGRYGGEEFIIVFVNTKKEEIKEKVESILEVIRNTVFNYKENEIVITFSAGISDSSEYNESSISVEKIIEEADNRLYKAKKTGRNKVIIL